LTNTFKSSSTSAPQLFASTLVGLCSRGNHKGTAKGQRLVCQWIRQACPDVSPLIQSAYEDATWA
jgi:hypothetical protein